MTARQRTLFAWALIGVGALFIVVGLYRGEEAVVFRKAVNLCLECIGLG